MALIVYLLFECCAVWASLSRPASRKRRAAARARAAGRGLVALVLLGSFMVGCVQLQVEKWRRHEFRQSRAVRPYPAATLSYGH